MDDLRTAASDGWTYTDADLREDMASGSFGSIEEFREQPARAQSLRFLVYIILAALLALIGFLGGTNWWSRIAWAAATLGVASILTLVAFVLVVKPVVRGLMDELRIGAAEGMESPTGLLLVEKVMEVAQAMANDFLSGIVRYSLVLFVFAGGGLCVGPSSGIVWPLPGAGSRARAFRPPSGPDAGTWLATV